MPTITFKVSDSQKHDFLWSLLNVNYNEENGWIVEYGICEIYEEYAIVRNYAEAKFERVYYTKNDETDSLEITNREDCFIVDVNEAERNALRNLHANNNGTYENVDTNYVSAASLEEANNSLANANATIEELNGTVSTLTEQNSEFSTKIEELTNENTTLSTERDTVKALCDEATDKFTNASNELAAAQSTIETLTTERDELATYKKNILDTEKKNIIAGYTEQLDASILEVYTTNLDSYTAEQLDMELTYKLKLARPELFSKTPAPVYLHMLNHDVTASVFTGLQYFATEDAEVDQTGISSMQNLRTEIGLGIHAKVAPKTNLWSEISLFNDAMRHNPYIFVADKQYEGTNPGRLGGRVNIGVSHQLNNSWTIQGSYSFEAADNNKEHNINIGAGYQF